MSTSSIALIPVALRRHLLARLTGCSARPGLLEKLLLGHRVRDQAPAVSTPPGLLVHPVKMVRAVCRTAGLPARKLKARRAARRGGR
jgi:hypothetical protein